MGVRPGGLRTKGLGTGLDKRPFSVLLANATHLMQPLDRTIFSPLKREIEKKVHNYNLHHSGEKLDKYTLIRVAQPAFETALGNSETIIEGFRVCGLVPWDPSAVTISRTKASTVFASNKDQSVTNLETAGATPQGPNEVMEAGSTSGNYN